MSELPTSRMSLTSIFYSSQNKLLMPRVLQTDIDDSSELVQLETRKNTVEWKKQFIFKKHKHFKCRFQINKSFYRLQSERCDKVTFKCLNPQKITNRIKIKLAITVRTHQKMFSISIYKCSGFANIMLRCCVYYLFSVCEQIKSIL